MANVTKRNRRNTERLDNSFGKYAPEVVARPVDTFVREQAPSFQFANADQKYRGLAASLAGVAPAINAFLQRKHEEQVAKDEATGMRLYHETGGQRLSWNDFRAAHDSRLKETGISTSVRNGYLKARMANEANIFRESINEAYNSGEAKVTLPDGTEIPVSESDDPSVFSLWMNRFTTDYIHRNLGKDVDPEYFAKIFVPQMEKIANEMQSKHIQERNAVLEDRNIGEHNKVISEGLSRLREPDGSITSDEERRKEVTGLISESIRSMLKSGVPRDKVLSSVAATLVGLALDPTLAMGEDVLYLAREVMLENGVSLWDTGSFARTFYQQMEQIEKSRFYKQQEERRQKKEQEQEEINGITAQMYQCIRDGQPVPRELEDAFVHKYGREELSRFYNDMRTILRGYDVEDDATKLDRHGLTREQTAAGAAYYDQLSKLLYSGRQLDLMSIISDPRWSWMDRTDQKHIIDLLSPKTTDEEKAIKHQQDQMRKDVLHDVEGELDTFLLTMKERSMAAKGENADARYWYYKDAITSMVKRDMKHMLNDPKYLNDPDLFSEDVRMLARGYAQFAASNPDLFDYMYDKGLKPSDVMQGMDSYIQDQERIVQSLEGKDDQNSRAVRDFARGVLQRLKPRQQQMRQQGWTTHAEQEQAIKKEQQKAQAKAAAQQKKTEASKQTEPFTVQFQPKDKREHELVTTHVPSGKDFYIQMVGGGQNRGVSSGFNSTRQVYGSKGKTRLHSGLDISADEGTLIQLPSIKGCDLWAVTEVGKGSKTYGNYVRLKGKGRDGEDIEVSMGHMQDGSLLNVTKGHGLKPGTPIGRVGNTGVSTGPHLDIKVKINGKYVDPQTVDLA